MDKETLSNYGWIVVCVMVLAVMIAWATPFGSFISEAVQSTTKGLFDVNKSALDSTGLINIDNQEFDVPNMNHGAENGGNAGETPVTPEPEQNVPDYGPLITIEFCNDNYIGTITAYQNITWEELAKSTINITLANEMGKTYNWTMIADANGIIVETGVRTSVR